MASQIRREAMIIVVQRGRAHTYNARRWSAWAHPLPVTMCESDELATSMAQLDSEGVEYVWIADSGYEPILSTFRLYLSRQIWEESVFTIFKVAAPTFSPHFYDKKYTASEDTHDRYGGLRYIQLAAVSDTSQPFEFDHKCGGRNIDYHDETVSRFTFPYSIFQLVSNESPQLVRSTYASLESRYPSITSYCSEGSILESHRQLAEMSDSNLFFVMDADFMLEKPLPIGDMKPWDEEYVHVWYVRNPINGLVYGHGGPKAFNKSAFLDLDHETVDVTTNANQKQMIVHTEVVGIHKFNWSSESSFRTAFREVSKLVWLRNEGGEEAHAAEERLGVWLDDLCVDEEQPFWEECLDGAHAAAEWAHDLTDVNDRVLINNFDWLHEQYEKYLAEAKLELETAIAEDQEDFQDSDFDESDFDDEDKEPH